MKSIDVMVIAKISWPNLKQLWLCNKYTILSRGNKIASIGAKLLSKMDLPQL